jgi:hypothetical protein
MDGSLQTDWYATLLLNHGKNPTNGKYEYAVLPNVAKAASWTPTYKVLAHENTLHAVYVPGLRVLAVNNFGSGPVTVKSPGTGISYQISGTAAVIIREGEAGQETVIAVQDPLGANAAIKVTALNSALGTVGTKAANITVAQSGKDTVFTVAFESSKRFNTWQAAAVVTSNDAQNDARLVSASLGGRNVSAATNWDGGASIANSGELTVMIPSNAARDLALNLSASAGGVAVKWVKTAKGASAPNADSAYTGTYGGDTKLSVSDGDVIWLLLKAKDGQTKLYYKITVSVKSAEASVLAVGGRSIAPSAWAGNGLSPQSAYSLDLFTLSGAFSILRPADISVSPGAKAELYKVMTFTGSALSEIALSGNNTTVAMKLTAEDGATVRYYCIKAAVIDETKPSVSTCAPTGGAADAATGGNIVISFSEAMKRGAGTVTLSGSTGGVRPGSGVWSGGEKVYTVSYDGLALGTEHTIKLSGFTDPVGNVMDAAEFRFTTGRKSVSISGVSVAGKTYDGTAVVPVGEVSVTAGAAPVSDHAALVYTYTNTADNSTSTAPPVKAGAYTLVISTAPGDTTYAGVSETISFNINRATVVITAVDKTATAGDPAPDYTYRVAGLVGGDTLAAEPALTSNADMSAAGDYTITPAGAAVPDTGNYNLGIIYMNGTLTVNPSNDSPPVDPTPVDPTPVDPTPVDPTPVDPTPVNPTPVNPTPVDPTPVNPTPTAPIINKPDSSGQVTVPDVEIEEGKVKVDLTEGKSEFGAAASAEVVSQNADKEVVISGGSVNVVIPTGTLKAGDDINSMLVKPNGSGNLIQVTLPDGGTKILPIAVVTDDSASYVATIRGEYKIVSNTKTFQDAEEHWGQADIEFVGSRELFQGDGVNFNPEQPMTRAMLATALWRIAGEQSGNTQYGDVDSQAWYFDAISWTGESGLMVGSDGAFRPEDTLTREELCTVLIRFVEFYGLTLNEKTGDTGSFEDAAKVSGWAKQAMDAAISAGLIEGADGFLSPQNSATRAQTAAVFARFIRNVTR